ncbi:hypothetical protein [Shewanella aestuarii]|uniref:KfrA N-terminal DNA-binding domain-containing protein n=1 Tax=Shewanella aestuarii TaxID=1028752 RepID=A0A6G9QK68_9GAMM|nr:hypothetical protein [Shewanella aestuarii]QIR14964.1 hypothetical protein HBH39_11100 [Shewanella aestuarii]
MSSIEQVIAAAKAIATNGHTPSVALIKSRVGKVPMPLIVQGLQQFKAMPKSEWQTIPEFQAPVTQQASQDMPSIEELLAQQQLMVEQIEMLIQRVTSLEQVLAGKTN